MARDDDADEDTVDPGKETREAEDSVKKITEKDPTDGLPMNVGEDGTVSFGDADARGEKTAKAGDEEDDEEDPSLTDPEREALRAKRREEKRRRREAARKREDDLRGQLAAVQRANQDLVGRLQQVEQRTTGIDVARIDEELRGAGYAYNQWQAEFKDAVAKADGERAAAAMDAMNKAKAEGERLWATKQAIQEARNRPAPQSVPPEVLSRVDAWRKKHPWYDPAKQDEDTLVALAVDKAVAKDGYHPGTDEFWEELDKRLRRRLPERYADDDDAGDIDQTPSRSSRSDGRGSNSTRRVPVSGGGASGSGSSPSFTLSADRITAMKEAGVWNDPSKREKAIRNYMAYDKANKRN